MGGLLKYVPQVQRVFKSPGKIGLTISQDKLLRILQFKHRKSPVKDLYKSFGVLKLTDMHKYNLIILMDKLMHHPNKIPGAIKDLLTLLSMLRSIATTQAINMTYMQHTYTYNTIHTMQYIPHLACERPGG